MYGSDSSVRGVYLDNKLAGLVRVDQVRTRGEPLLGGTVNTVGLGSPSKLHFREW